MRTAVDTRSFVRNNWCTRDDTNLLLGDVEQFDRNVILCSALILNISLICRDHPTLSPRHLVIWRQSHSHKTEDSHRNNLPRPRSPSRPTRRSTRLTCYWGEKDLKPLNDWEVLFWVLVLSPLDPCQGGQMLRFLKNNPHKTVSRGTMQQRSLEARFIKCFKKWQSNKVQVNYAINEGSFI